jgi:hypothetical protein
MKCTPHCTMTSAFTLVASTRELQRVADIIGDAVVDFRRLVVVRQDDGVALLLQLVDRLHVGRKDRPFDGGNDVS